MEAFFLIDIQELLGHKDVKITMVYTHVLKQSPKGAWRPYEGKTKSFIYKPYNTLVTSSIAVMRCFHKAYSNFGRGVLYSNFAS